MLDAAVNGPGELVFSNGIFDMPPAGVAISFGALLVFARFLPMTLLLPGIGGLQISWAVRIGLAVVLTTLVAPVVGSDHAWSTWCQEPGTALGESLFCGAAVGCTIRLLVLALAWAGDWLSELVSGQDPADESAFAGTAGQTPLGKFQGWLGLLIFWSIGGIPMAVDATLHSFQALPLGGSPPSSVSFAHWIGGVLQQATELAVRVGSPVCLSLVAAHLALALIQRALPRWQVGSLQVASSWIVLWIALLLTVGFHMEFVSDHWINTLAALGAAQPP